MRGKLICASIAMLFVPFGSVQAQRPSMGNGGATSVSDWEAVGPPGGDVNDVNSSPTAPNVVLAGVAPCGTTTGGSLYRSSDSASTWSEVMALSGTSVYDIEFAPDGTAIIGTSNGVWKSDDDGRTWTRLNAGLEGRWRVFEIAFDPNNAAHVWAGVSSDCDQSKNVIRSTDGGATWSDRTPLMAMPVSCRGITFDPNDSNKVYACFSSAFGGSIFWVSTDAGDTWKHRSRGLPNITLNDVVHDGTRLLVAGGELFGYRNGGLWKSTDDGETWRPMHNDTWPVRELSDIEVDPNDADVICLASLGAGVYRTADGGATWAFGVGGTSGLSLRAVRFAPGSSETLFLGADSYGPFKSTNSGGTFDSSMVGIRHLDTTSVGANPNNPDELAIAFQSHNKGGIRTSLDRGETWKAEPVPKTRWGTVGFHPDGTLYAISHGPSSVAPEGLYRRNLDGSWTGLGPDQGRSYESDLTAMRFSRNDPDLILLGGRDNRAVGNGATIWRSEDAGASWTKVYKRAEWNMSVTSIEIVEDGTDATMLASWNDSASHCRPAGALRSVDGGFTWFESFDGLNPTTGGEVLAPSPVDIHTFYLATASCGLSGGVYKTTDAGLTWMKTGFFDACTHDVVCARTDDQVLYIMKKYWDKVFWSTNGGMTFSPFLAGLEFAGRARDLAYAAGPDPFLLLATSKSVYMHSLLPQSDETSVHALEEKKDLRDVNSLIAAMNDENPRAREQAARSLREKNDDRAVEPLINALKDEHSGVRENAAWALGKMEDDRAVSSLIRALKDEHPFVRGKAAWALGRIKDDRAVMELIGALKDERANVRARAARALGNICDGRAVEPLIIIVDDEHPDVREKAAETLGKLKDERAVEPLIATLKDEASLVRGAAADSLEQIGAPAIALLIHALNEKNPRARSNAYYALRRITGQSFGEDPAVWREWYEQQDAE